MSVRDYPGRFTCARCGGEANKHQGHYWSWCKVTNEFGEHHFCCPDDCELEARASS